MEAYWHRRAARPRCRRLSACLRVQRSDLRPGVPRALHAPRPGDATELTALLAQSRLTDPVLTGPRHVWHFNYTTAHRLYKSIQYDHCPSRNILARAALETGEEFPICAARSRGARPPSPRAARRSSHRGCAGVRATGRFPQRATPSLALAR